MCLSCDEEETLIESLRRGIKDRSTLTDETLAHAIERIEHLQERRHDYDDYNDYG